MAQKSTAQSAAFSASKRKNAVIEISNAVQEKIKVAIRGFEHAHEQSPVGNQQQTLNDYITSTCQLYKQLSDQGFTDSQIQHAMHALPLQALSIGLLLDWLLVHLDRGELPKLYADQIQSTADIELLHRASSIDKNVATEENDNNETLDNNKEKEEIKAKENAARKQQLQKEEEELRKKMEKEEEARKAWILQYADDSSSSSDNDDDDRVVDDWEILGESKKQQKNASLPRDQLLLLIATELAEAKRSGLKAKEKKDKSGQQASGKKIGQLKKQMMEFNISDNDLPIIEHIQSDGDDGDNNRKDDNMKGDACDRNKEQGESLQVDKKEKGEEEEGKNRDEEKNHTSNTNTNDDSDYALDFNLLETTMEETTSSQHASSTTTTIADIEDPIARRKAALSYARTILQSTGAAVSTSSAQLLHKKQGAKSRSSKNEPTHKDIKSNHHQKQQPKVLLQQLCQQKGWVPPRYEKLPPSGISGSIQNGYRYQVIIDIKPPTTKKEIAKSNLQYTGRQLCSLSELDNDSWSKIEEAQNAVATGALFKFFGKENFYLWKEIPMPYCELWLVWQAEGVDRVVVGVASKEEIEVREEFVKALVEEKMAHFISNNNTSINNNNKSFGNDNCDDDDIDKRTYWMSSIEKRAIAQKQNEHAHALKIEKESENMLNGFLSFQSSMEGKKWKEAREKLPASVLRQKLLQSLSQHDVVVVSGETGSGKTTQIPQYILEGETENLRGGRCNIVCTQPRRIAAISVAERVANERGEPAPGDKGSTVGYAVRLDTATSSTTRLLFCTTGILLRRLASDPALANVSHIIVDEVHERTMQGDFLIALLKELVVLRRSFGLPLKVVLMSATLDAELISNYFEGCPTLHAAGRTFPVEQRFLEDVYEEVGYVLASDAPAALKLSSNWQTQRKQLEKLAKSRNQGAVKSGWGDDEDDAPALNPHYNEDDYEHYSVRVRRNLARVDEEKIDFDLLEDLVTFIHETEGEGAILVFLPGMAEISNLHRRLQGAGKLFDARWIIPLHSTVAPADQRRAFKVPPKGVRKVVIATNIAETSLTIEDVVYVIDTGRLKERRHDPARSMSLLVEDWVSKASAKQRRGRAGRVKEGICYALYTKCRFESKMKEYQTPEMLRVPLEELVLQVHLLALGKNAAEFLGKMLQPPSIKAVEGAVRVLNQVGAVTEDEKLTPLGYHLAQLPVDVRVGKLLVLASSLGCLSPALSIAACLSHKQPFASAMQQQDEVNRAQKALCAPDSKTIAANQQSDHLIMAAAVQGWLAALRQGGTRAATEYTRKYCLVPQTLDMLADMRSQFAVMLADIGFATSSTVTASHHGNGDDTNRSGLHRGKGAKHNSNNTAASSLRWYDDASLPANKYASHPAVVKSVLLAALYPSIAVMDESSVSLSIGQPPLWHDGTGPVSIHPSSVLSSLDVARFQRPFATYLEKMRTHRVFLRDCTVVSPSSIVLFGGKIDVDHASHRVTVDNWIHIRAPAQIAALIRQLRHALELLLEKKILAPKKGGGGAAGVGDDAVVKAIVELLDHEEASQNWDV